MMNTKHYTYQKQTYTIYAHLKTDIYTYPKHVFSNDLPFVQITFWIFEKLVNEILFECYKIA